MARYQLTIRTPNGKKWRIRPVTGSEFRQIVGELKLAASNRIGNIDLLALWPDKTFDRWRKFAADAFDAMLRTVRDSVQRGEHRILKTGTGLLDGVSAWMESFGWSEVTSCDIAKRLMKIVISLAVGYLRSQFPVIGAANSLAVVDALDSLVLQRA